MERLHVRIAHAGLSSRRAAEKLIQEGRVTVNGEIVREMGVKVSQEDDVRVDGVVAGEARKHSVLLYKPLGVITTLSDPHGRPTIVKYLPNYGVPLKPVGRLDMDTEGILICTNDGDLAHLLAHPRYGIEKEYVAQVMGVPNDTTLRKLREGIYLEGKRTSPAGFEVIHSELAREMATLKVVLHEGRKRQIRLMLEAVGHPVQTLKRVRIGHLTSKGMRSGECRRIGEQDLERLRKSVGT